MDRIKKRFLAVDDSVEGTVVKKLKFFTHALLLSGTLNIAFLFTFIFLAITQKNHLDIEKSVSYSKDRISLSRTNHQILSSYFCASFTDLLEELANTELLEDGYCHRDLALAYLAAFHYFDVERALPGVKIQRRKMLFIHEDGGERLELVVFPGLNDHCYQSLLYYAQVEEWPFTTEGLFYELSRRKNILPPSLIQAFYCRDEFNQLYNYVTRTEIPIAKFELLGMLLDGQYDTLKKFAKRFSSEKELSVEVAREFFLEYLKGQSPSAAEIFVRMDEMFSPRQLSDADLAVIIDQIDHSTAQKSKLENLLMELIHSVRSDFIRKKAGIKLCLLAQEEPPVPYDHVKVLRRFIPAVQKADVPRQDPLLLYTHNDSQNKMDQGRRHRVKEGETLWQISRKYRVDLLVLMEINHLQSEYVLPIGKELLIP